MIDVHNPPDGQIASRHFGNQDKMVVDYVKLDIAQATAWK